MLTWMFGAYLGMSVITFAAYALDKHRAKLARRRISERTLHLLELFGGWPGGLAAQRVLRHKSSKGRYLAVFWGIATLHVALWGAWLML